MFVFAASALLAFGLYGDEVKSNLLLNISQEHSILPTILQLMFIVIAVVHIPLIFYAGKEAVLIIFDEITRKSYSQPPRVPFENSKEKLISSNEELKNQAKSNTNDAQADGSVFKCDISDKAVDTTALYSEATKFKPNPKEYLNMNPVFYYLITLILYFIVILLSIVVGDVRIFFGIIGSSVGCFLTFLAPGSFYLISFHKSNKKLDSILDTIIYIFAYVYSFTGVMGII